MTTANAKTAELETTNVAPAADAPTTPVAEKAPSKMAKCEALYNEVFKPGYDLGGKSQRAVFIKRAMEELEMTKNGANTYYQNLSNAARGKGKYKYNKYVGKAGSKSEAKGQAEPKGEDGLDLPGGATIGKSDVELAEAAALKTAADLSKRWQVLDDDKVVASYDTRNAAKKAATGGLVWRDAQAK